MSDRQNPVASEMARRSRLTGNGMIQPGAHTEFEQETPLEKLGNWFSQTFGAKHTPKPSPSTGPVTPEAPMSPAMEDSLSRKYLKR